MSLRLSPAGLVLPDAMALVTETWPPEINGVAMTLARLASGLGEKGVAVQVVRPRQLDSAGFDAPGLEHLLMPGLPIPGYQGLRFGLPAVGRLRRYWTAHRPRVVHIATEGPLGWSALRVAEQLGIPVTTSFHTNFHSYCRHYGLGWLNRAVMGYLKSFHNRTLCTLAPSEPCARSLEANGYLNTGVLGRGIDTRLFNPCKRNDTLRRLWGAREKTLVALYVGRLAREKNLEVAVDAFTALKRNAPDACMVWVGDGPERAKLSRRLPDHIFVGAKTGEALAQHYASADVFLFPSLTETFGNVVLEAMASGLAVLAYRYAAAGQHLSHGHNGLVAPYGDRAAFSEVAMALGADPGLVRRLGRQAAADVAGLSWNAVLDQFADRLATAAAAKPGNE